MATPTLETESQYCFIKFASLVLNLQFALSVIMHNLRQSAMRETHTGDKDFRSCVQSHAESRRGGVGGEPTQRKTQDAAEVHVKKVFISTTV